MQSFCSLLLEDKTDKADKTDKVVHIIDRRRSRSGEITRDA